MNANDVLELDLDARGSPPKRKSRKSKLATVQSSSEAFRLAELKHQDPAVFAHILADHFVAKEAQEGAVKTPKPPKPPRPAAGTASLGSFRSWQFGERCLATYRVLFGRPLWAATTPTPSGSRKRKHLTPPTSSSSDSSDGSNVSQEMAALELETEELLALPTVDELLELKDEADEKGSNATATANALEDFTMDLDDGLDVTGADAVDLLWDIDAAVVDGVDTGMLLTEREEEELRFLASSPHAFAVGSPDLDDLDGI